ncbi:MAG: hypothetical protein ACK559_02920, partial [bacterium]
VARRPMSPRTTARRRVSARTTVSIDASRGRPRTPSRSSSSATRSCGANMSMPGRRYPTT